MMAEDPRLGHIEKVDVREAWPHEESDFTPWLAEHISELGIALGLELELQSREAPVGKLELDLLARDSEENRPVIIENQLEKTDPDHLGRLLVYAGGYDASVIVWVATDFREEHRQALDWLNQRTNQDTSFFGVVIELLKIGDSRLAPNFRIVASPNEWRKKSASSLQAGDQSDKDRRYEEFFQRLVDHLRERKYTNRRIKSKPYRCVFSTEYGRVRYRAVFSQGNRAKVVVNIYSPDKDSNKTLFDQLKEQKEAIESDLTFPLEWDRMDSNIPSRISISRQGNIDDDQESLEEIDNWMTDKLFNFKHVFDPRLEELL